MLRFNRSYSLLFHVCAWSLLFGCVLLWRPHPPMHPEPLLTNWQVILTGVPFIVLFYVHAYYLIPIYFTNRKTGPYLLTLLAALAFLTFVSSIVGYMKTGVPTRTPVFFLRRLTPGLFIIMASAAVGAFRANFKQEKKQKEKETERLRTELSFLRAQVNPHFMLNVLNSMALLARRKSDLLEPVLMELAGLMNYMLYDANQEKISLEDEIRYLRSYIDLQMLRFGDDVTVKFNMPATLDSKYLEPMLLIPIVENAFKHGIGLINDPIIIIDIGILRGNRLSMIVQNKCNPLLQQQENRPSGIGLTNLNKRLEILYPGRFELNASHNYDKDPNNRGTWFITTLNIPVQ